MVTGPTKNDTKLTRLTPPSEGFNDHAFGDCYDKGGKDYLGLNPYKKNGLEQILRFCEIEVPSDFWDNGTPIKQYFEVLKLVQNNARPSASVRIRHFTHQNLVEAYSVYLGSGS